MYIIKITLKHIRSALGMERKNLKKSRKSIHLPPPKKKPTRERISMFGRDQSWG